MRCGRRSLLWAGAARPAPQWIAAAQKLLYSKEYADARLGATQMRGGRLTSGATASGAAASQVENATCLASSCAREAVRFAMARARHSTSGAQRAQPCGLGNRTAGALRRCWTAVRAGRWLLCDSSGREACGCLAKRDCRAAPASTQQVVRADTPWVQVTASGLPANTGSLPCETVARRKLCYSDGKDQSDAKDYPPTTAKASPRRVAHGQSQPSSTAEIQRGSQP